MDKQLKTDKNKLFTKRSRTCMIINLLVFLLFASAIIFIIIKTELSIILKIISIPSSLIITGFLCERIISIAVNKLVYMLMKK
ncbi:MAG: hypothetical protein IJ305_01655 [Oscillospiraceae bacterium]|nr:hypothetical protein [Oscillospiraceae bacterium]